MSEQGFERWSREGGYTFVTHPDYPGFSFLLLPGEGDHELNKSFGIYLEALDRARSSQ